MGRLVGAFKTVSTKRINALRDTPGSPFWQRGYYECIVRDDTELQRIRDYVIGNPYTWDTDQDNPDRTQGTET